jgi:hypothetical protein
MIGTAAKATAVRGAAVASYVYGLLAAAAVGHLLLGIPIQLTDCYGNMLKLDRPWTELLVSEFTQRSYLRPFLFAELKLVYDASGGNYFAWFRGVHVSQVAAAVVMYLTLVRPRTWRDAALVPLGVAALLAVHTFRGTVNEAFPINTFLTIVLCCLAAANLALMEHRWWTDVLAVALFVVATLTVESGLLIWVIFIGAALVGARGVSRAGLALLVALLAGYFVLRFAVLNVGSPGLIERASGYGFHTLEPEQLIATFGDNPLRFYAYNIATSIMSVLFSEPRGGVFRLVYGFSLGTPESSAIVNVLASTCATILIGVFGWRRRRAWLSWHFERDDRLVLLFVMVLIANATISYPYTKDVIMSPAGAMYAVAVFAAARGLFGATTWNPTLAGRVAAATVCAVLGVTWAIRSVTLHLDLVHMARKVRTEWAYADHWIAEQSDYPDTPQARALFKRLQNDAIYARPGRPGFSIAEYRVFVD